jgi:signal transduction histidine kinase
MFDKTSSIIPPSLFSETKRSNLVKKVLLILYVIPCAYVVVYLFYDTRAISIPLLTLFLLLPILISLLNRLGYFEPSKIVGLLGYNISIFLVASSESNETGVYLHFITCCTVAIALFSYEVRWKSYLFIALSTILFILVHLGSFNIIAFRELPPLQTNIFFIVHSIGMMLISTYCIFMILGLNHSSKKHLIESRKIIETQNQELRKTNEELDRFVYSASHDLRAPLSSIHGLVNLMDMDNQTPKDEFIEKIKRQISNMETLMRDIVDYSRNSRSEVNYESIDLHNMVNDVHNFFSHYENSEYILFENKIPLKQLIKSDAYRLKVILNNLISNAVKYADSTKEKSFIYVSFHTIEEETQQIRIEDNGVGISADHLPKIFDMFYRASSTSKGSGLGLYIAHESAQKMNYKIEVESVFKKGTIFKINIPSTS